MKYGKHTKTRDGKIALKVFEDPIFTFKEMSNAPNVEVKDKIKAEIPIRGGLVLTPPLIWYANKPASERKVKYVIGVMGFEKPRLGELAITAKDSEVLIEFEADLPLSLVNSTIFKEGIRQFREKL
ncbi:STK_08120 family protein [Stygiolobus caldivivus]|uniref:DUF3211 domain-containing protein n=1 Tax=Stygiolobus caldivivus TaxID=2824673 RepID=A0A8D5U7Q5_9CREN|nr:STK_08120 family protein [Stygiolobus caldivivus]BCU71126.1 hypothetical protein KN1_24230 [Stygiolobus caldivivus]